MKYNFCYALSLVVLICHCNCVVIEYDTTPSSSAAELSNPNQNIVKTEHTAQKNRDSPEHQKTTETPLQLVESSLPTITQGLFLQKVAEPKISPLVTIKAENVAVKTAEPVKNKVVHEFAENAVTDWGETNMPYIVTLYDSDEEQDSGKRETRKPSRKQKKKSLNESLERPNYPRISEDEEFFEQEDRKILDEENELEFDEHHFQEIDKKHDQEIDKENDQEIDKENELEFDEHHFQEIDKKHDQEIDKKNDQEIDKKNDQEIDEEHYEADDQEINEENYQVDGEKNNEKSFEEVYAQNGILLEQINTKLQEVEQETIETANMRNEENLNKNRDSEIRLANLPTVSHVKTENSVGSQFAENFTADLGIHNDLQNLEDSYAASHSKIGHIENVDDADSKKNQKFDFDLRTANSEELEELHTVKGIGKVQSRTAISYWYTGSMLNYANIGQKNEISTFYAIAVDKSESNVPEHGSKTPNTSVVSTSAKTESNFLYSVWHAIAEFSRIRKILVFFGFGKV